MTKFHHFLLRGLGILVAVLVFAPTVALCYDVYGGGYDSYSGSYSSNWDYDNSAYDNSTNYSSGDSSYSSNDSSYSSGSSGDTSGSVSSNATVKASASVAKISSTVTVEVAGGPGNRLDWVGLYAVGAGAKNYLDWQYLNGSKAAPSSGRASATLSFKMPATPGNYEFRFFPNNEYTLLAKSGVIDVKTELPAAPEPTPTPAPAPVATTVDYADSGTVVDSGSALPVRSSVAVDTVAPVASQPVTPTTKPVVAPAPAVMVPAEVESLNQLIPPGAKIVFVENIDGVYTVFDKETGAAVPLAFYDVNTKSIYYGNSDELYGKMLTENMGYIEPEKFAGAPSADEATSTAVSTTPTTTATPAPTRPSVIKAVGDFFKSVADAIAGFFRSFFFIFKK